MLYTIKLRRGPSAEWTTDNPILASGEPGLELDTGRFKIGNGSTPWSSLPYYINEDSISEKIQEAIETIPVGGTYIHTQTISSSTWIITHNLGFNPNVSVLGLTGYEVDALVNHPTINTVTIFLAASMTGTAHLT